MTALAAGPAARQGLVEALGHKTVTGALPNAIRDLMQAKMIEYTLLEKPQSRLQRCRLSGSFSKSRLPEGQ
jgi:ATP-dependent DNA helicase RecG